jgi:hypothetical protein
MRRAGAFLAIVDIKMPPTHTDASATRASFGNGRLGRLPTAAPRPGQHARLVHSLGAQEREYREYAAAVVVG